MVKIINKNLKYRQCLSSFYDKIAVILDVGGIRIKWCRRTKSFWHRLKMSSYVYETNLWKRV